jgi:hypothetical protein
MSYKEYRLVEVCEECGELVEHCICDEYDEYEDDCDCEDCECCEYCSDCDDEPDESTQEEFRLIGETIEKIFEVYPCQDCVADAVIELAYRFRDIGWTDCKDMMKEFLG